MKKKYKIVPQLKGSRCVTMVLVNHFQLRIIILSNENKY